MCLRSIKRHLTFPTIIASGIFNIQSFRWEKGRVKKKKLSKFNATAFVYKANINTDAANCLHENQNFEYVLPPTCSKYLLETFLRKARRHCGVQFLHPVVFIPLCCSIISVRRSNIVKRRCNSDFA